MTQTLSDLRGLIKPKPQQPRAAPKSAAIDKPRPKAKSKFSIESVLAVVPPNAKMAASWTLKTFPIAFSVVPHKIRPLSIGITSDLKGHAEKVSPPLTEDELSKFMFWWCRRGAYLRAIAVGGKRITLSGEPAEDLTEQAINHARTELERRGQAKVKGAAGS